MGLVILAMTACHSGSQDWEHFLHKHAGEGTTIRLNGLMKFGLQFWADADTNPKAGEVVRILKKMKGVQIHIFDGSRADFSPLEINHLASRLDKSAYRPFLDLRKGTQQVHLWSRGSGDALTDPLMLVSTGGTLVMAEMKGTLSAADLQTLIRFGTEEIGD